MTEQEYYFEIQYTTHNEPTYWRSIGYPYKSYIDVAQKVREYIDKEKSSTESKFVHSFRIIERRVHVTIEEIKTFKLE